MRVPATSTKSIAVGLFALALGIRLLFIYQSHGLADFRTPTPGLDICLHWEGAKQIRAGAPDPCFELMPPSAPFHPYFVAGCQVLLGESVLRHRLLRAVLGSLTIVLVFAIGLRVTRNRWAALISALAVLSLPSWIYFDTMLIKASVELLMLSAAIWLVTLPTDNWRPRRVLGHGLLLGALLSLLRFSQGGTVLFVAVMAVYLAAREQAGGWRRRLLVIVPMVVLVLGTQLGFKHRETLFGVPATRFLPVSGVHMRIGFQPGATGTYHVLRRFPALPLGHTYFSRMAAEARAGRPLTAAEANQTYIDEARAFMREDPAETRRVLARKLGLFFNNFETRGNHHLPDVKKDAFILRLPSVGYGGLVVLGCWGVIALWRKRRFAVLFLLLGLVGSVLTANLASFVTSRYRLHATLPMALLAGPGLWLLIDRLRELSSARKMYRARIVSQLAAMLGVGALAALVAFRPVLPNARVSMTKTSVKNREMSVNAEKLIAELAEIEAMPDPKLRDREKRGIILHRLGRYTEAYQVLESIAREHPEATGSARQYLVYLLWHGNYDDAVEFLLELDGKSSRAAKGLIFSFASNSGFWHGADTNLKLIVQALLRDIVVPRFEQELAERKRRPWPR